MTRKKPQACPWEVRSHSFDFSSRGRIALNESLVPPETTLPDHAHEPAVLSLVLHGGFRERYRDTNRTGTPASVVYYAPGAVHSGTFSHAETRLFSVDLPRHLVSDPSIRRLESGVGELPGLGVARAMFDLCRTLRFDGGSKRRSLDGSIRSLITALSRSAAPRPQAASRLAPVCDLLRCNYREPPRPSELAQMLGMHPVHLARLFRQAYGCTLGQYVKRIRVSRAIGRLCTTSDSLAGIALELGFADQSHFGRAFKQVTGTSPALYRRRFSPS